MMKLKLFNIAVLLIFFSSILTANGVFIKIAVNDFSPASSPAKICINIYNPIHRTNASLAVGRNGLIPRNPQNSLDDNLNNLAKSESWNVGESSEWLDLSSYLGKNDAALCVISLWQQGGTKKSFAKKHDGNVEEMSLTVLLATAPNDNSIVRRLNYSEKFSNFSLYFPEIRNNLANFAERVITMPEYAHKRYNCYIAGGAKPFTLTPSIMIAADSHRGYHVSLYDQATNQLEDKIQQLLGVNREIVRLPFAPKDFWDLNEITKDYDKKCGSRKTNVGCVKLGDEPPLPTINALKSSPIGMALFTKYISNVLPELRHTTIAPIEKSEVKTSTDAKLYYHQVIFLQESFMMAMRAARNSIIKNWGNGVQVQTDVYWAGFDRMPDYFYEARMKATDRQGHHYGSGDTYGPRQTMYDLYLGDTLRSAAKYYGIETGMLWFVSRIGQGEGTELNGASAIISALRGIHFYGYGPLFSGWEYFSDDRYKVDAFLAAAKICRMYGFAGEIIHWKNLPQAKCAIILSRSANIWTRGMKNELVAETAHDATKKQLATQEAEIYASVVDIWGNERRMLHAAMRLSGINADIIPEEEITEERLGQYKLIFLVEPNLTELATNNLLTWVKNGNTLYLGVNAMTRDEANLPRNLPFQVNRLLKTNSNGKIYNEDTINTLPCLAKLSNNMELQGCVEELILPIDAEVIAKFNNQTIAGWRAKYGNGFICKIGFPLGTLLATTSKPNFTAYRQFEPLPASRNNYFCGQGAYYRRDLAPTLTEMLTKIANSAKIVPSVALPMGIDSGLFISAQQAILVLANYSTLNYPICHIKFDLPFEASKAISFSGNAIKLNVHPEGALFSHQIDIPLSVSEVIKLEK